MFRANFDITCLMGGRGNALSARVAGALPQPPHCKRNLLSSGRMNDIVSWIIENVS